MSKSKKTRSKPRATDKAVSVTKTAVEVPGTAAQRVSPLGFSYGASLVRPCLGLLRANFESSLVIFMLPSMLLLLGTLLVGNGERITDLAALGSLLTLVGIVWFFMSALALPYFVLQVARGKQPGVMESYRNGIRFAPKLIGLTLLVLPLTVGGLCLLVVPGLIVLRRYCLASFFIIEHDMGIRESMDHSAQATKAATQATYGVLAVLALFLALGAGFSRAASPYGSIAAVIVESLYLLAFPLLYLKLRPSSEEISGQ
jgi:hypothetical protein